MIILYSYLLSENLQNVLGPLWAILTSLFEGVLWTIIDKRGWFFCIVELHFKYQ